MAVYGVEGDGREMKLIITILLIYYILYYIYYNIYSIIYNIFLYTYRMIMMVICKLRKNKM